jgi:glutathione-independent formaldehyde dehydrogenase
VSSTTSSPTTTRSSRGSSGTYKPVVAIVVCWSSKRPSEPALHPGVEEKALFPAVEPFRRGVLVDRGVEAVGYQAHDQSGEEHPELVLDNLVASVRSTGGIGVIGVYVPEDPGAKDERAKQGRIGFDYGTLFSKGHSMGTGQAPVKRYNRQLRDLIISGRARPSFIVSHELGLEQAPVGYQHFDRRDEGWTKVVLHPSSAA